MAYQPKTVATDKSVEEYIATLDESQQRDSRTLIDMMQRVSGCPPVLWGTMIGFDKYHYKSKSGIEADWPRLAFAPRKGKLTLYVTYDTANYTDDLEKIGKYTTGKGCIYLRKLDNVDLNALEALVVKAHKDNQALY